MREVSFKEFKKESHQMTGNVEVQTSRYAWVCSADLEEGLGFGFFGFFLFDSLWVMHGTSKILRRFNNNFYLQT